MALETKLIEHIVLFKVKSTENQAEVDDWASNLANLNSLDCVLALRVAPLKNSFYYTHILHSRFADMEALNQYRFHPLHLEVIHKHGSAVVEDILGLDWEASLQNLDQHDPSMDQFKALRVVLVKPRHSFDPAVTLPCLPVSGQTSFGKNVCPGRDKGFCYGFLGLFQGTDQLGNFGADRNLGQEIEEIMILEAVYP